MNSKITLTIFCMVLAITFLCQMLFADLTILQRALSGLFCGIFLLAACKANSITEQEHSQGIH